MNNIKNEENTSDLFNGLSLNNNNNNNEIEKNKNDEDGSYSGFNLMENNNSEINDVNNETKIKELN